MKYENFLYENFQFIEVKFSIYMNRRVFVMCCFKFTYLITNSADPDQLASSEAK